MKQKLNLLFFGILLCQISFAQDDLAGCEDHPLITRFPEAKIGWCETQEFMEYHVATGKYAGYRAIDKWIDVEGKVQRIYYVVKSGATMSEVYQNYRNSITRAGFDILAKGLHPQRNVSKEVGGKTWLEAAYLKNPIPTNTGVALLRGSATSGGAGYVAAKLERSTGNVYIVLTSYQFTTEETVVLLDIIEEAPLDDGKIEVDADYIAREIEMNGSVALYGIYFDFDKASIKPESKETLDAIAEYLKKHAKVSLYVVGHTDMKGTLVYNLELAEKRSKSVVEALVNDYQISRSRLEGQGVGPLSPKSNNTSEAGRKLNRRVELVRKI